MTTLSIGNALISHAAFLFLMALLSFFLILESRRFCSYEASRIRVLLLESSFFPQLLQADRDADSGWLDQLVYMLQHPTPTIRMRESISWRLRVNYLWLFAVVVMIWLAKLGLAPGIESPFDLINQARLGFLPGWFVLSTVLCGYTLLMVTALTAQPTLTGVDHHIEALLRHDRD